MGSTSPPPTWLSQRVSATAGGTANGGRARSIESDLERVWREGSGVYGCMHPVEAPLPGRGESCAVASAACGPSPRPLSRRTASPKGPRGRSCRQMPNESAEVRNSYVACRYKSNRPYYHERSFVTGNCVCDCPSRVSLSGTGTLHLNEYEYLKVSIEERYVT